MIELREVTKEYSKGVAALNGINLKIEQGEFVFIVGDSGSGKSTLIKLIMKELEPTSGTIIVNGNNLSRMKHRRVPMYRRNIGVVFQDFRLLKDRNIYENIAFAQRVTETSTRIIKKKVPAALSLVGLAQKYKAFPKELSGGEQQRVAIATLCCSPPDNSFGNALYFWASPTSDSAAGTFFLIILVGVSVTLCANAIFS